MTARTRYERPLQPLQGHTNGEDRRHVVQVQAHEVGPPASVQVLRAQQLLVVHRCQHLIQLQLQGINLHARATHAGRRRVGRPALPRIPEQGDRGPAQGAQDEG